MEKKRGEMLMPGWLDQWGGQEHFTWAVEENEGRCSMRGGGVQYRATQFVHLHDSFQRYGISLKPGNRVDGDVYNQQIQRNAADGRMTQAHQLLQEMTLMNMRRSPATFNALLSGCVNQKDWSTFDESLSLFQQQPGLRPDLVTYNLQMARLARDHRFEDAHALLDHLHHQPSPKLKPTARTYQALFEALRHTDLPQALALLDHMDAKGVAINSFFVNGVLDSWSKQDQPQQAWKYFDRLLEERADLVDQVSWNIVVALCCRANQLPRLLRYVHRMNEQQVQLPAKTRGLLIATVLKSGPWDGALTLLTKELTYLHQPEQHHSLILQIVDNLGRARRWDRLHQAVHWIHQQGLSLDSAAYNAILSHVGKAKRYQDVTRYVNQMKEDGVAWDIRTYGALMHAYNRLQQYDRTWALYQQLKEEGKEPSIVIFGSLLFALGQTARWHDAETVMREMLALRLEPNAVIANIGRTFPPLLRVMHQIFPKCPALPPVS